ncbi:ricin-type beta-trefoil lectin domain protein [Kitasatospora sp. MAA4]|uniref:ricin-type beta-trefoil lectin domain protein n=1 Tax=Kitasatospora sp. MAA4 TaxID=3035093 RepID=UPI0024756124|nr:ricin-type beta-trefoil lectin domain protein [Kitasatospora sp. MAA4]
MNRASVARLLALGVSGALAVGMLVAPAAQADAPIPVPVPTGSTATGSTAPAPSPTAQAILDARTKAKSSGQAVTVDALTTGSSATLVNPDGTLTTTDYTAPVRIKEDAGWAAIDATLRTNADGTLSPAVSPTSLKLSGGGSGALATLTTSDGKQLSVTAPFALPKPTLSGATATYAGVLTPDVDLQVTADPQGGWRDVIVVKTAAAAADPALKSLHFPISTMGLTAGSDAAGNLAFTDSTGAVRLHAPTPMQWDSTPPPPAVPTASGAVASRARSLFAAPAASAAQQAGTSTPDAPGDSAKVGTIGVAATPDAIDLTPDQNVLGKGVGPWYLDPSISVNSAAQAWDMVQENHPDTKNYMGPFDLGIGYCGYSDCTGYGRYRAYVQIGINSAIYNQPGGAPAPPTVYGSTLFVNITDASSPSTPSPLGLYWTNPIDGNTTWNNQPCGTGATMAGCSKVASTIATGTGPISFDVTSQMQTAAQQKWGNWTIGIAPDDENNLLYRHHIGNNPHIVTTYDIAPSLWAPRVSPQPGFANSDNSGNPTGSDCATSGTNAPWVGGNQNITLTASNWSPAGMSLHTVFRLWNDAGWSWTGDSGWAASQNSNVSVSIPGTSLADGHLFAWTANAYDADPPSGGLGSPNVPTCFFRIDKTSPTLVVSSSDFPPSGTPNPSPKVYAGSGVGGTFTLTGNDPAPTLTGTTASGVACFRWSTDPTPVTGWKCSDGAGAGIVLQSSNPSFTYAPGSASWGTNIVYVQAQDNAGNYGQPAAYSFFAPWNPNGKSVYGDVTGDGKPDILLPDAAGNLRIVTAGVDPANAISAYATAAPGVNWNTAQVTHRGNLDAGPVDDIVVHQPGNGTLSWSKNNGNGTFSTLSPVQPFPTRCTDLKGIPWQGTCPFTATGNWSNVTQILALGTPSGESTSSASIGRTSLLAVSGGQLWLLNSTTGSDQLDGTARLVSAADWSNYDLINPGPASGPSAGGAMQPTLWARFRDSNDTGKLLAYPITGGSTPDYSQLADPAKGLTITGLSLPVATYPTVGSSGDLNGDGVPDLWATTSTGQLVIWTGSTTGCPSTASYTCFTPTSQTHPADLRTPVGRWPLATSTTAATGVITTPDALNQHAGVVKGAVTFPADTIDGVPTNVAQLDPNGTGEIDMTGSTLDTSKSFTVNVWAKPTATGGIVASEDGTSASGFMLWPDKNTNTWRFALSNADSNGWPYDQTDDIISSSATVQTSVWTHLVASYDADSHQTSLYVNGTLAANGHHTTNSGIAGPLVVGRYQLAGQHSSYYAGSVADLVVSPYATNTANPAPHPIVSGVAANKCIDDNGASTVPGSVIQIYDCNGTNAQQWTVNANGTLNVMGGCLDNSNAVNSNGNLVQWTNCTGNPAQQWIPRADSSIYNPATGRCLDDPNGSTVNGTQLQIYDCNGSPAQRWLIAPGS